MQYQGDSEDLNPTEDLSGKSFKTFYKNTTFNEEDV